MKHWILAAWVSLAAAAARFRGWRTLVIASWNIGPAREVPQRLRDGDVDIVALQEAGDQWGRGGMVTKLRAIGYRFITGNDPGQQSTPLGWNPRSMRLVKVRRYLLAESQDGGPGAGPDQVKQKWAIGGLFEILDTGRYGWFFCDHFVASQQHRKRLGIALFMLNRMRLLVHRLRRPVFWIGDKNAKPGDPLVDEAEAAGWSINQIIGELLGTHGRRAIDQVWWTTRRWIEFLRHAVIATQSDHKLLIVDLAIKPRRPRKKENR